MVHRKVNIGLSSNFGINAVSAGIGPRTLKPIPRSQPQAGEITFISSLPRYPPSPAWGSTPIRLSVEQKYEIDSPTLDELAGYRAVFARHLSAA